MYLMNIKGNLKYIISGSLLFLLIYLFIAAIPIGPDLYFEPVWTRDLGTSAHTEISELPTHALSDSEAFILGPRFGYFTPEGKILANVETAGRASASAHAWCAYTETPQSTTVYFTGEFPPITIQEEGFVYLNDQRLYLFSPGGSCVSQYDRNGQKRWTREHNAPITAFNSSPAATVIGYADGSITYLDSDGNNVVSFSPGGSNRLVILGVAVSNDGTLISCVSGLSQQRYMLIRITGRQHKVLQHSYLSKDVNRQVYTGFDQKGHFAFFEIGDGLVLMDTKKLISHIVPLSGKVLSTGDGSLDKVFLVLSQVDTTYTLTAIEWPNHSVASTSFSGHNAFLIQREHTFYLGLDNSISRFDIRGVQ